MDDIITKSNERVAGFFRTLNEMQVKIEKNNRQQSSSTWRRKVSN